MDKAKSRTSHRRGPKAGGQSEDAAPPVRVMSLRGTSGRSFGGNPTELAERHLRRFYLDEKVPDERDVTHFRATRALVVAARRWRKLANERIKDIGQNMARWETLYLLAVTEEEMPQSELAWVVGVKGPSMVAMLNSLEQDGLIERYQSNVDRRVTHNRITEKGWAKAREIMAITNQLRGALLEDIDPAKLAIAIDVLEAIHGKLDELS
jgi:MarR family transcriptional regulator for hemolysin